MRYAPLLHHPDGRFHGLVSAISDSNGKIVNLHRTFLNADGTKAETEKAKNKLTMRGTIPEGSSIKLYATNGVLAISEGIETALRYMVMHKVPTWSCVASKRLETFMPPDDVNELILAGDNDESFTGQSAVFNAANRIWVERKRRGIPIKITPHIAPDVGKDWADY
jgi:putative DNA primase/helicase